MLPFYGFNCEYNIFPQDIRQFVPATFQGPNASLGRS